MQLQTFLRSAEHVSVLLLVILSLHTARAGSATWDINPPTNDWNTAGNWTPNTVPNSPNDTATFSGTNVHTVVIHSDVELNALVFTDQGYSSTITAGDASSSNVATFTISGSGVVDDSQYQFYDLEAAPTLAANGARNKVVIKNDATLADTTDVRANGATSADSVGGQIQFSDNATVGPGAATALPGENGGGAGEILFLDNSSASKEGGVSNGDLAAFASGAGSTPGQIVFKGTSTASNAYMAAWGSTAAGVEGGKISFLESSNAGDFVVVALSGGGAVPGAGGGSIIFSDTASASSAHLSAYNSTVSGGGSIQFLSDSSGGTAQVEVGASIFGGGNATLSINNHNPPGVTLGSLSGSGVVILGSNSLTLGSNNLSANFRGSIKGSGSLTKIGTGIQGLRGSSTYTGGTTVNAGVLRVTNRTGSATGTGVVNIQTGALAGSGSIAGPVTLQMGTFLQPNNRRSHHSLTIYSTLSFLTASTYSGRLDLGTVIADQVVANGVTIATGANFDLTAVGDGTLALGTTFAIISNTSANPISGTFDNLPDGAILTLKGNNLQASYEGGDGNDLTLTVVP